MRLITISVLAGVSIAQPLLPAEKPNAEAILKQVDNLRNPLVNFSLDLQLVSYQNDRSESSGFRIYGQGSDKSLVEFVSPAAEKGKFLLMLRDAMWIYVPDTSRPIRISPLQRLLGEASNGDVARTNYSVDYSVPSMTEEETDGTSAYVLELQAKDPDLSYSRVRLWVAKKDLFPLKADYYVSSGKLMKTLVFQTFGTINGIRMATTLEILDDVRPGRRTVMTYSKLEAKRLPEKMFQATYLGKM